MYCKIMFKIETSFKKSIISASSGQISIIFLIDVSQTEPYKCHISKCLSLLTIVILMTGELFILKFARTLFY